mgnify:CR=1 FL=1
MAAARVNIPLSNLRAVVIVIVVAFHAVLPYLASQPASPFQFDAAPYRWVAFPIIDRERFFGFDLFCAWQDVSLMSLMFFLAGLFTPASLRRKGSLQFLIERWWRIGLPFCLAAAILSPLAYYASYRTTEADLSLAAFWQHWLALPMWPAGPAWFLWQLFVFSALVSAMNWIAPQSLQALDRFVARFDDRPAGFLVLLVALSAAAYVPLALGYSAWDWASRGPFAFQISRPLLYFLYFFTGIALGCHGLERGLARHDGPLARHWLGMLGLAIASFFLWGELTSLTLPDWDASPFPARLAAALAFPLACAAGVLSLLTIALHRLNFQDRALDSLSANAYGIYLVHYVIVVWLQYALLQSGLPAAAKGALVLGLALPASWAVSAGLRAFFPLLARLGSRDALLQQRR